MAKVNKAEVKEVAPAKTEVAVVEQPQSSLPQVGATPIDMQGFDRSDVIIPRILLMQGMSELVSSGEFKMGDLVNMLTNEKLGDLKTPLEVIPVAALPKTVVVSERAPKKQRFDYVKTQTQTEFLRDKYGEEALAKNSEDDLMKRTQLEETQEDGMIHRYDKCLNFYVLLASDVAKDEAFPLVVTFRRTSYAAGKQLATHFIKQAMLRQAPHSKTLKLAPTTDTNEEGVTYAIHQILPGRKAEAQEMAAAEQWKPFLASGKVQVQSDEVIAKADGVEKEIKQF
jgi:hypothetical protein